MTPKEKAEELVNKFRKEFDWVESQYAIDLYRDTRQCALIAVDEILNGISETWEVGSYDFESTNDFWQSVKQEIEKL
jgi:hypothetical protein